VLTYETGMGVRNKEENLTDELRFSGFTDCIVLLDLDARDRLRRTVCVLKARNSAHEMGIHELSITSTGLQVG
jgi:KaiC/GvpD/RAD55 family RecA-like ATPase